MTHSFFFEKVRISNLLQESFQIESIFCQYIPSEQVAMFFRDLMLLILIETFLQFYLDLMASYLIEQLYLSMMNSEKDHALIVPVYKPF